MSFGYKIDIQTKRKSLRIGIGRVEKNTKQWTILKEAL